MKYVPMPIELTPEMIAADPYGLGYGRLQAIYKALISAAPASPASASLCLAQQDEREAFEAWYDKQFVNPGFAKHHRHGDSYCTVELSDRWMGWKARAALTAPQDAQERNTIIEECAKVCDERAAMFESASQFIAIEDEQCAAAIRALKSAQPADKQEGKAEQQAVLTDSYGPNSLRQKTMAERVLEKAAQPQLSDEEIERIAIECGFRKSNEHWGDRYYTELGRNLFAFARELLSRQSGDKGKSLPSTDRMMEIVRERGMDLE